MPTPSQDTGRRSVTNGQRRPDSPASAGAPTRDPSAPSKNVSKRGWSSGCLARLAGIAMWTRSARIHSRLSETHVPTEGVGTPCPRAQILPLRPSEALEFRGLIARLQGFLLWPAPRAAVGVVSTRRARPISLRQEQCPCPAWYFPGSSAPSSTRTACRPTRCVVVPSPLLVWRLGPAGLCVCP